MTMEISPEDKIRSKDVWLSDMGNDAEAGIEQKSYEPTTCGADTRSFDNLEFWKIMVTGSNDGQTGVG